MNYKELKEKLSKVDLLSAYPFINNYGICTKTNKETGKDELVVEFGVSVKIKFDEINGKYMLPRSLSAYGIDIKTKISQVEQASINFTSDKDEAIKYYEKVGINLEQSYDYMQLQTDYNNYQDALAENSMLSAEISYSFNPLSQYLDPIKRNRQKARPLSGGCSSIFYGSGNSSDATFGLFVRDKQDKRIVALSNSHVYSRSLLLGEEALASGQANNMLVLSARQPGNASYNTYGSTDPAVDHIGIPKRTSRLSLQGSNKIDACILELSSYNDIDATSNNIIWFKQRGPYEFATTEEIDSLIEPASINYQSPVFRSGRTLGPLGYPGSDHDGFSSTRPSSSTSIISLNETLTTNEGFNTLTNGVSSVYFSSYVTTSMPTQATLIYTTADETSAFIVGYKNYYTGSNSLFSTSYNDYSPELTINDPAGIKDISIYHAYFGSAYINKLGKIYHNRQFLSNTVRTMFNLYINPISDRIPILNPNPTIWSPVSSNNGDIFAKPTKKSCFTSHGSFALTEDNELWTLGANICVTANGDTYFGAPSDTPFTSESSLRFSVCGLPYQVNDREEIRQSVQKFTKIPGEWIDFGFHFTSSSDTFLYAISASGDLFAAYFSVEASQYYHTNDMSPMLFNGFIQTPPQLIISSGSWSLSCSPDLSHTKIPLIVDGENIKIKKIFTNTSSDGDLGSSAKEPLLFQTEDDKILVFSKPTTSSSTYATGYLKYDGDDIVVTGKTETIHGRGSSNQTMTILSGNNIYSIGGSSSTLATAVDEGTWISTLGDGKDYDIQTLLPYTNYFDLKKWDNMPPNNCKNACGSIGYLASLYGSNANSSNFEGDYGATIIYTDGIGLSGIGYAPSGILGLYDTPQRDEIIMSSVNRSINVNGFTASGGALLVAECLDFKMKNENGAAAAGGDSGTAVFACLSSTIPTLSTFKLVGLLFASPASTYLSPGYGVRIDNIQNELDIEPWDGII